VTGDESGSEATRAAWSPIALRGGGCKVDSVTNMATLDLNFTVVG